MNKSIVFVSKVLVMGMFVAGCAKENTLSTHQVAVQFSSYSTAQNKINNKLWSIFLPQEANATVTSLKMCFKRLRFKMADETTSADPMADSDNIDFNLGEINISSGATALGTIALPAGNYKRVEFDLENSCASGKSITLVNSNGSFSSTDRITIKFEGDFTANADGTLTLGVQQILTQLNSYSASGTLKTAAESISGALSN